MSRSIFRTSTSFIEWFRAERERRGSQGRLIHFGLQRYTACLFVEAIAGNTSHPWSLGSVPANATLKAAREAWLAALEATILLYFVAEEERRTSVLASRQGLLDHLKSPFGHLSWSDLREVSDDQLCALLTKHDYAILHQSVDLVGFGALTVLRGQPRESENNQPQQTRG